MFFKKEKKFFLWEHNSIFKEIRPHIKVVDKIEDCDVVLLWNDLYQTERKIIELARYLKKKTAVLQHGRRGSSRYFPPFNEPITADYLLVWGEGDRDALIDAGHPKNKIKVVGFPLGKLPKKTNQTGTKTIIFCPEHWDRPVDENIRVRDELRKLKGYNVITKIIESHNLVDFDNTIQTNRLNEDHLDKCKEVLSCCALVIGISESTFELMAQAMDIPVIIVEDWEPKSFGGDTRYLNYRRVISTASKKTSLENLLETIKQQLENPNELKNERKKVVELEGGLHVDIVDKLKNL